jgi:hypothetical protein
MLNENSNSRASVMTHSKAKPASCTTNNFRLRVNRIEDFDQLIESKEYFVHFIKSRYNKTLSLGFSEAFERMIENHNRSHDIEYIKLWLLKIINGPSSKETQFYEFLKDNYSEINVPFATLYNNYISSVDNPLGKNLVSRSLTALGLKTTIVRKKHNDGTWKFSIIVHASNDELTEIFRKNGI